LPPVSGGPGPAAATGYQDVKEEAMSVLTRWHPFRELPHEMRRFRREMDRLFGRWGIDLPGWPAPAVSYPRVNLWEDNDFVYAEAELPGLKLQDLEVTVTGDNQLTLKGKREPLAPEKAEWHRQERGFGSFERVLTLPVSVDASKVEARLENGVLTVRMAKSPAAKPRTIPVKAE
jgi:HSP20 family protein